MLTPRDLCLIEAKLKRKQQHFSLRCYFNCHTVVVAVQRLAGCWNCLSFSFRETSSCRFQSTSSASVFRLWKREIRCSAHWWLKRVRKWRIMWVCVHVCVNVYVYMFVCLFYPVYNVLSQGSPWCPWRRSSNSFRWVGVSNSWHVCVCVCVCVCGWITEMANWTELSVLLLLVCTTF